MSYDLRGRMVSLIDPLGALTQFQVDAAGNRTAVIDPRGRQTTSAYDANNRLVTLADPAGGTTVYIYDTESNLLALTDAKGQTTAFAYDDRNRLVTRTDPLGASEHLSYDPVGNLTSRTDRKGQTLAYSYDALNRRIEKTLPDGIVVASTYDPVGRLLTVSDPQGTISYSYDLLGRVLTTTSQDGRTLANTYDAVGNRTALRDETGQSLSYAYDARNRLIALTDPRTGSFTFAYDRLGRRASLTRPNGIQTSYAYDLASRLLALTHASPGSTLEGFTYTYDPGGNRTADTRNQEAHRYGYDLLDQLTQVQAPAAATRWKTEEAYTYDLVGNRLTDKAQHPSQFDAANRLTADGQFTYAYDANGNLTEKFRLADGARTTYAYDAEDRLIGVVSPKVEVSFRYDPLGRRTEKRVVRWQDEDGDSIPDPTEEQPPRVTRYLYDGQAILATFTEAGKERARYTPGPGIDEPLAELHHRQLTFYHGDLLGSIIALTDASGQLLRQYHYQAFGLPEDYRADRQPYRFTGREWDKELKLYFYRARYYDPRAGRFTAKDPVGFAGGMNAYRHVLNNPTNRIDPTGTFDLGSYASLSLSITKPGGSGTVYYLNGLEQGTLSPTTLFGMSLDLQLGWIPPLEKPASEYGVGLGKHLGVGQFMAEPRPGGGFDYSGIALHLGVGLPTTPTGIYITGYEPVPIDWKLPPVAEQNYCWTADKSRPPRKPGEYYWERGR